MQNFHEVLWLKVMRKLPINEYFYATTNCVIEFELWENVCLEMALPASNGDSWAAMGIATELGPITIRQLWWLIRPRLIKARPKASSHFFVRCFLKSFSVMKVSLSDSTGCSRRRKVAKAVNASQLICNKAKHNKAILWVRPEMCLVIDDKNVMCF